MDIKLLIPLKYLEVVTDKNEKRRYLTYRGREIQQLEDIKNMMGHYFCDAFCKHVFEKVNQKIQQNDVFSMLKSFERGYDYQRDLEDYIKKIRDDYVHNTPLPDRVNTVRHSVSIYYDKGDRFSDSEYNLCIDGIAYSLKEKNREWHFNDHGGGQYVMNPFDVQDILLIVKVFNILEKTRNVGNICSILKAIGSGELSYSTFEQRYAMLEVLQLKNDDATDFILGQSRDTQEITLNL